MENRKSRKERAESKYKSRMKKIIKPFNNYEILQNIYRIIYALCSLTERLMVKLFVEYKLIDQTNLHQKNLIYRRRDISSNIENFANKNFPLCPLR